MCTSCSVHNSIYMYIGWKLISHYMYVHTSMRVSYAYMYSRGQKKVNTSFSCNGAFYRLRFVFVSFPFYRFVTFYRFVSFPFSVPTPRSTDGRPVNGVLERLHTITIAMSLR